MYTVKMSETPKKIAKKGRPPKHESATDYCRICKCKFKLVRCSSLNLFVSNQRDGFKCIVLGDMCEKSGIHITKSHIFSDRVCVTCGRKLRDFCSSASDIRKSINQPHASFVQPASPNDGKVRYKRQTRTSTEHSPTVRKVPKTSTKDEENLERQGQGSAKKKLFKEYTNKRSKVASESINIGSFFHLDSDLLTVEQKKSTVSVVIKNPNGNVVVHVTDSNAVSVVRNIDVKTGSQLRFPFSNAKV